MKSRRTRAVAALFTVTAAAAAAVLVGPGYEASQVWMRSGKVWLASTRAGEATLLDGASAEVQAHVPVAKAGTALTVVQQGSKAVVLNRETGELSGVDGATERVSPPVEVLPPSDGLVVLPAPDGLYAVDVHSGLAAAVDATTLAPRGEPAQLAEEIRPDTAVMDGNGRLWAIDDTTGDLVWLSENQRRTRSAAGKTGRLAITGGRPALVDPDRGTAELLNPETGAVEKSVRADLRTGDAVVVGGSADQARVLIATSGRGELITCAFGTGSCSAPVQVGAAGAEFGTPIEVDGHAVVPDYSTGQATIVNLADSHVVAQRQLFDRPTRFELLARDGIVFFNDADGNRAGVLELSGEVRAITKYTEKPAEDDGPLTPDTPAQPNQATKVGHNKQKPGVGVTGRTVQPSRVEPGPGPVAPAAIVVEPGNHGVVGDEFELTMVVPSAPGATAATTWQFGDGTGATGATVRHSWQQTGTFTVRAAGVFGDGVRAEAETTVIVDPAAAPARITALNVRRPKPVIGESVRFSADTTKAPDGWEWTVTRPGSALPEVTARTAEFAHTFATPGTYTVALTVTVGKQTTTSSRQFTVVRGAVKGWGSPYWGVSVPPPSASSGVVAIEAGNSHALALKSNGEVIAWGDNYKEIATVPDEATSEVVAIAAGSIHNVVLKSDGSLFAWGSNSMNETNVPTGRDFVAIAAAGSHSLALKSDGSVLAWGGNNLWGEREVPHAALSGVVAISAGGYTSMALKADGTVVTWGSNCATDTPVTDAVAISAGTEACLALKRDGSVFAWGSGGNGETSVPPGAMSDVIAVDAHQEHVLALKSDGTAIGWGWNNNGQSSVPPQYNKGVLAVSAGSYFSLVLMEGMDD